MLTTFNETRAPTSRKYVYKTGIVMPNWSNTFPMFRSHSSVFAIEKLPKSLNFQSLFTSNRPLGGNFQWKACTNFKKICSWTRYSHTKLVENIETFTLHSSVFALEKEAKNLNFESFFTSNRPLVATFNEPRALTSRKYVAKQGIAMPNWWKTFQTFWSHSSVCTLEN